MCDRLVFYSSCFKKIIEHSRFTSFYATVKLFFYLNKNVFMQLSYSRITYDNKHMINISFL